MTLGSTVDFNFNDRRAIAWDERRCRERLEAMPAGGADSQHSQHGRDYVIGWYKCNGRLARLTYSLYRVY